MILWGGGGGAMILVLLLGDEGGERLKIEDEKRVWTGHKPEARKRMATHGRQYLRALQRRACMTIYSSLESVLPFELI